MPVELQFAIRIVAFIIGLLLVLTFARSMVRVALVNHPTRDGVSRNVHRLAYYVSCVLRPGKPDDISAQQRQFLSLLPSVHLSARLLLVPSGANWLRPDDLGGPC